MVSTGISELTNMQYMFSGCTAITSIPASWQGLENVIDASYAFANTGLTSIPGTWEYLGRDIGSTTLTLDGLFNGTKITNVPSWTGFASNVSAIKCWYMFKSCTNLATIPSSWNGLSKLNALYGVFDGCSALTAIPDSWVGLESCQSLGSTFRNCVLLTSLPSSWTGLNSVTNMQYTFSGCTALTTIGTSDYTALASVEYVTQVFSNCTSLTSDILALYNSFVAKITYSYMYSGAFYNCTNAAGYSSIPAAWK